MADRPWWTEIETSDEGRDLTPEEDALAMRAYAGFLQGDLMPLAEYLRAGGPLNFIFRRELVHAITGEDDPEFRLELRKRGKRGPGNRMTKLQTSIRDLKIGWFIQSKLPEANGQTEAAFSAAMVEFQEKRGVIVAAWSRFKKTTWYRLGNSEK